jgi:hypothetical protein
MKVKLFVYIIFLFNNTFKKHMIELLIRKFTIDKMANMYQFMGMGFFGGTFIANNWTTYVYRDHYFHFENKMLLDFTKIIRTQCLIVPKSLYVGFTWPFVCADLVLNSTEKKNYIAFRHFIPFASWYEEHYGGIGIKSCKCNKDTTKHEHIDAVKSIKKYGPVGFFSGKYCLTEQN